MMRLQELNCDQNYKLIVAYKNGGLLFETQSDLMRLCSPVSRVSVKSSSRSPASNKDCYYEKRRISGSEQCIRACYQKELVTNEQVVKREHCSQK